LVETINETPTALIGVKLGDKTTFKISRPDKYLDVAWWSATKVAMKRFGIDENGDAFWMEGWDRKKCHIRLTIVAEETVFSAGRERHVWYFEAVTVREPD